MLCKRSSHALAIVDIGARHRPQILHGDIRRDRAGADLLLHGFGQLLYQSQPSRNPTHAAIEATRQIFQAVTETSLQLLKQPAFFQCGFLLGKTYRPIQDQGIGFAHVPDDDVDRVAP